MANFDDELRLDERTPERGSYVDRNRRGGSRFLMNGGCGMAVGAAMLVAVSLVAGGLAYDKFFAPKPETPASTPLTVLVSDLREEDRWEVVSAKYYVKNKITDRHAVNVPLIGPVQYAETSVNTESTGRCGGGINNLAKEPQIQIDGDRIVVEYNEPEVLSCYDQITQFDDEVGWFKLSKDKRNAELAGVNARLMEEAKKDGLAGRVANIVRLKTEALLLRLRYRDIRVDFKAPPAPEDRIQRPLASPSPSPAAR